MPGSDSCFCTPPPFFFWLRKLRTLPTHKTVTGAVSPLDFISDLPSALCSPLGVSTELHLGIWGGAHGPDFSQSKHGISWPAAAGSGLGKWGALLENEGFPGPWRSLGSFGSGLKLWPSRLTSERKPELSWGNAEFWVHHRSPVSTG